MPLLLKFLVPLIEMYDMTKDPDLKGSHDLTRLPRGGACRAFPLTLKGLARMWFGSLVPGSIKSFGELAHLFLK